MSNTEKETRLSVWGNGDSQEDKVHEDVTIGVGEGHTVERILGPVTDRMVADAYNKIAEPVYSYKTTETAIPDDLIVKDQMVQLIINGGLNGGVYLDGCTGTGWSMEAVLKQCSPSQAIGIDISERMIEVAQRDAKNKGSMAQYFVGSVANIEIKDEMVDAIGVSNGLDCVVDLEKTFKEFYRVLKPGHGRLVFTVRAPERNMAYIEAHNQSLRERGIEGGQIEYRGGRGNWYGETWEGTEGNMVLRQYMEIPDWHLLLTTNGFRVEFISEPYAEDYVYAINPEIWQKYNKHSGRKSALLIAARKEK